MTPEQIIGLVLALALMLAGLIGAVVPGLPGMPLLIVAAVGHRLWFGDSSASVLVVVLIVVLAIVAQLLDYLAGMVGAKKMGATWRGVVGAVAGGLVGLFFSLPGILLGPFIGATLLELIGGREFKAAAKAGLGATLGLVVGGVGKIS